MPLGINMTWVTAIILVLVILIAVLNALSKRGSRDLPYQQRRLMTERERHVYGLIEAAVPGCRVHAQVAMAALIDVKSGLSPTERTAARNRFDRKIVDYVLERRDTGDVAAIVELDDRTHRPAKDKDRDRIAGAAGYITIRLPAGERVTRELVSKKLAALTLFQGTLLR